MCYNYIYLRVYYYIGGFLTREGRRMNFLLTANEAGFRFADFFRYIGRLFLSVGPLDILRFAVDILLLSLILYMAVRFLWDRRAGKLLLGLAIWMVALLLARFLGLVAVGTEAAEG